MSKNLKTITLEEIEDKIHNHQLWLKGDTDDKRADFTGYELHHFAVEYQKSYGDISDDDEYYESTKFFHVFEGKNLTNAIFTKSSLTGFYFSGANLKNVNFQYASLDYCTFKNANLILADFRNAKHFDFSMFNETQIQDAIFTDTEYEEKVKKRLEKQEKEIEEKDIVIENTNDEQTDLLIDGFKEIKDDFELEERRWLIIAMFSFVVIIALTIICIIDYILPGNTIQHLMWLLFTSVFIIIGILFAISKDKKNKEINDIPFISWPTWKNLGLTIGKLFIVLYIYASIYRFNRYIETINNKNESLFHFDNPYYILLPFSLGLFSFIYFSISQYSKAKELRIENQNKIALLHGFQSINSNELIKNKETFHQNISDVVFTKAYMNKNSQNLPIDKVIDLIKLSK